MATSQIRKIGLIGVPYNVGWTGPGVAEAIGAFRAAGLADELAALDVEFADLGDIQVDLPPKDDSDSELLNPAQVIAICNALADAVSGALADGYFPLIVGGEDGVIMGILEGFNRKLAETFSLVYLDAHGDFNTPATSPSGLIGGMNIAISAGIGVPELVNMFGHAPLVKPENIVLYGTRDLDPGERKLVERSRVALYDADSVREVTPTGAVNDIVTDLTGRTGKIYVHIDLDVMDESVIAAHCLPVPNGLSREEFVTTIRGFVASGVLCGLGVMVFNAEKDPDGTDARKVVEIVRDILAE
jgi:arginase